MLKELDAQRHVLAMLVMPSVARAECATARAALIRDPSIELVFRGSVVGLNTIGDLGVRVTFIVDRVWKGSVPTRFDLYVGGRNSARTRARSSANLARVCRRIKGGHRDGYVG